MKSVQETKPDPTRLAYPSLVFGVVILLLIGYCLIASNSECVLSFGRSGFSWDCTPERDSSYWRLGSHGLFGLFWIAVGAIQLRKKKEQSGSNPGQDAD